MGATDPDDHGPAPATVTRLRPWSAPEGDGFDRFYEEQTPGLVHLATLLVGSRAVAEDLVQDTFVRVHARWGRIQTPVAYTRRAVVNACRSHLRRRMHERRHQASLGIEVADLEARELLDALARLPQRQRAVVVLRFYCDLSERDTAQALGCAPGTVGSLLHRALVTLRTSIDR